MAGKPLVPSEGILAVDNLESNGPGGRAQSHQPGAPMDKSPTRAATACSRCRVYSRPSTSASGFCFRWNQAAKASMFILCLSFRGRPTMGAARRCA
jgi:hypothetical protein